ncbi:MAG: hypothetical protein WCG92_25980 [Hyphomicrobiales bacterium]
MPEARHDAMKTGWLALLFGFVLAIGAAREGRAHDPYSTWTSPDNPNLSCCNDADCRPTRAYLVDDGLWRAWDGIVWLTVPPGGFRAHYRRQQCPHS